MENGVAGMQQTDNIDILLLHTIERDQRTLVTVSDIINPSRFSVQPEDCKEQLVELRNQMKLVRRRAILYQLQLLCACGRMRQAYDFAQTTLA